LTGDRWNKVRDLFVKYRYANTNRPVFRWCDDEHDGECAQTGGSCWAAVYQRYQELASKWCSPKVYLTV